MKIEFLAKQVVKRLVDAGHIAYYAGGWVRDYLLSRSCDDVDIATSATPEEVSKLFSKTVAVGASFGVMVVIFKGRSFEVATFRRDGAYINGRQPVDVIYSKPQEDAFRRDFTINGMFFDPLKEKIFDFVGGKEDLEKGVIRAIGSPLERFSEDRLRMIRAVRFTTRFDFILDGETKKAIQKKAKELFPSVSVERIWQELSSMVDDQTFSESILLLHDLNLLAEVFPALSGLSKEDLSKRLQPISHFPKGVPAILYVFQLFPHFDKEERFVMCKYLKVSNRESQLALLALEARNLLFQDVEAVDWVHFYACEGSDLCLQVAIACFSSAEDRKRLQAEERSRKTYLSKHIKRSKEHKPLLTAKRLILEGVRPGRSMGSLLREAERIAVEQDLEDEQELLDRLKKTRVWEESNNA